MTDTELLVKVLKDGLMLLVRDGLIDEARAEERAKNQAMALLGVFELKRHKDDEETPETKLLCSWGSGALLCSLPYPHRGLHANRAGIVFDDYGTVFMNGKP